MDCAITRYLRYVAMPIRDCASRRILSILPTDAFPSSCSICRHPLNKEKGGSEHCPLPLLCIHPPNHLNRPDVLNDGLAPAIDVRPRAVAHSVTVAGYVHHIPATILRSGHVVVRLLVGNHNEAVATLTQFVQRTTKLRASMRLAVHDGVAQGEATTCRHCGERIREGIDAHLFGNLAQQYREARSRIHAQHFRARRQLRVHAARNVNEQNSLARQTHLAAEAREHRLLDPRLPLRSMTRRSDEAERQHALDANHFERIAYQLRIDARGLHVAQVAKQSESAEAVLDQHRLPHLALLLATREPHLPRLR